MREFVYRTCTRHEREKAEKDNRYKYLESYSCTAQGTSGGWHRHICRDKARRRRRRNLVRKIRIVATAKMLLNAQESSIADDEAATSDAAQPVYSRRLVKRYVFRVVLIILVPRVRLSRHISSSRSRSSHAARVADIRANSHHRRSPSSNATALRSFYIFVYAK